MAREPVSVVISWIVIIRSVSLGTIPRNDTAYSDTCRLLELVSSSEIFLEMSPRRVVAVLTADSDTFLLIGICLGIFHGVFSYCSPAPCFSSAALSFSPVTLAVSRGRVCGVGSDEVVHHVVSVIVISCNFFASLSLWKWLRRRTSLGVRVRYIRMIVASSGVIAWSTCSCTYSSKCDTSFELVER